MKKIAVASIFGVITVTCLLLIGYESYIGEKERYYLSDWRPGIWIIGTTTNAIIVKPKVTQFEETKEYFLGCCEPDFEIDNQLSEKTNQELRGRELQTYRGYFVIAKDGSTCATTLTVEEFKGMIFKLGIHQSEQAAPEQPLPAAQFR